METSIGIQTYVKQDFPPCHKILVKIKLKNDGDKTIDIYIYVKQDWPLSPILFRVYIDKLE